MFFYSCNSQKKSKIEDEKQKTEHKTTISQPFDLAYLTLNENINDILTAVNLSKKDTINADFTTLLGNEKLVFGSDKVLIFNGDKLSGGNGLGTNNVIFHYGKIDKEIGPLYNEKEDVVGMCQINLYDETTSTKLLNSLYLKLNKPNDVVLSLHSCSQKNSVNKKEMIAEFIKNTPNPSGYSSQPQYRLEQYSSNCRWEIRVNDMLLFLGEMSHTKKSLTS